MTSSTEEAKDAIRIGSFRIDPRAGRLTCAGETVPLRPKTWSVLLYLAQRPGVLVSKDELLDAIWPDVAVTPDTLTKSIGELRQALGDSSKSPRYVETVHRRGFRFVAGASPAPAPFPPSEQELQARPFVGRAPELAHLHQALAMAQSGKRQIVFVTGPAGIGKSALLDTFLGACARSAGETDVWVGNGTCVEQHGAYEPYMPVLEALERLARRPDGEPLRDQLRRTAPTWLAQMPWLSSEDTETPRQALQPARPERMLRELATLTEALTSVVTIVLVLEDLHWGDPSTADLLYFLGQRREPARLLVIGTYRPAEAAIREHPLCTVAHTLKLRQQCTGLSLHELTQSEVRDYLERRFPNADFPMALAPCLHRHTDGNPLFVIGVVEHLLSRGLILETAPGWALGVAPERLDLGIPEDVRRTIETQLEVVSPADREMLEGASVGGMEFSVQGVAAALACDPGDIEMRCEELARTHRFLRTAGRTEWPDGSVARRYAFIHELYRQVVYGGIPDLRRQHLHQRTGEALEAGHGDAATDVAAQLAIHFQRGGDYRRAIHYLAAAAGRARQRFANREALGYLESALELVPELPEAGERQRHELALRLALAPIVSDQHGFASDQVRESCDRTYVLCAQAGTREQRFQVLQALCHLHAVRADQQLAPMVAAEIDALAHELGSPDYRLEADSVLIRMAAIHGRFAEACRLAEGFVRHTTPAAQSLPTYGADPVLGAWPHHAFALWMLGHPERAHPMMDAALAAVRQQGSPFTLTATLFFSAFLQVLERNPDAARDVVEEAASHAAEHGFSFWDTLASALRGWLQVQDGAVREGIATLEQAAIALEAISARLFSTYVRAFLAEAHLAARTFDRGLVAVEEGLAIAETTLDRTYWPELWRLKGELLLRSAPLQRRNRRRGGSDPLRQEGERCLQRALQLAREYGAKSLELRAASSLASAWQGAGRAAEARAVLAPVCEWFGPAALGQDIAAARALLVEPRRR